MTPVGDDLTRWVFSPSTDRGIHHWRGKEWRFVSYASLSEMVRDAAAALSQHDVAGRATCILASDPIDFAKCFFGVLLAGGTPCPISPPLVFGDANAYRQQLGHLLRAANPALVVTDPRLADTARAASPTSVVHVPEFEGRSWTSDPPPSELALLQFTSGSSGAPRAVCVTRENLVFMLRLLRTWVGMTPLDTTATWLPLYHDMGLIGTLLTPVVTGSGVRIMTPYEFIQSPSRWLECLGVHGATHTSAPSFGYALAARRVAKAAIAKMDLSSVRACIVGAERIDPAALEAFHELLGPVGLRRSAFLPAYGLAEATLAVTGVTPGETPRVMRPDWSSLRFGERVGILEMGTLGEQPVGDGSGWLVGSGKPHPAVSVTIEGPDGAAPDLTLGEVRVAGPLVARGYLGEVSEGARFTSSALATGDAGFIHEGELYVVGRMGDSVKIRGRHVYVEDLEAQLAAVGPLDRRSAVLPALDVGTEGFVLVVESSAGDWMSAAVDVIRRATSDDARVRIVAVGKKGILRTSSGKPRRRVMWQRLLSGDLVYRTLFDTDDDREHRAG